MDVIVRNAVVSDTATHRNTRIKEHLLRNPLKDTILSCVVGVPSYSKTAFAPTSIFVNDVTSAQNLIYGALYSAIFTFD